VLAAEGIDFEEPALPLLARAADGSMRDGLSLLDQAIAFGGGRLQADDVRRMLGTHTGDLVPGLVAALAAGDGKGALAEVDRLAELTPDFAAVLTELINLLHRIALAQQVPATVADDDPDAETLRRLAAEVPVEDVQLFYQVLLTGQRDLPLAPDPRTGFEMVLLRALVFRPAGADGGAGGTGPSSRSGAGGMNPQTPSQAGSTAAPEGAAGATGLLDGADRAAGPAEAPRSSAGVAPPQVRAYTDVGAAPRATLRSADDWHGLVEALPLEGLARQLAAHCALEAWDGKTLRLSLASSLANLRVAGAEQRLGAALAAALGCEVALRIEVSRTGDGAAAPGRPSGAQQLAETPAGREARSAAERVAAAEAAMDADAVAGELKRRFDADWVPGSIRPSE
jgi:DNA polymerase-3 subunit gamma/tau